MNVNLESVTQYKILALLMEKGESLGMSFDEHTEVGYNSQSGYVYLWDECYMFSLGLTDFAYNRGEREVELILSCPETGEEFFDTDETSLYNQFRDSNFYREFCGEEGIE